MKERSDKSKVNVNGKTQIIPHKFKVCDKYTNATCTIQCHTLDCCNIVKESLHSVLIASPNDACIYCFIIVVPICIIVHGLTGPEILFKKNCS